MTTAALWTEPPPATRAERAVAIATVTAMTALMLCAIGHLFLMPSALVGRGNWGFPDYSYVALMVLISALVITHTTLSEDAIRPRTIIVLSSTVGGIGTLMALAKGWLMLIGAAFADEDWIAYSVYGAIALSILPFVLPFAVGVILLRNDFEPVKWRVRAVVFAVASATLIIVLAALIPHWAWAVEMGVNT